MDRLATEAEGNPGTEDMLLGEQSGTADYHGRLAKARELNRRAIDSALRNDAKEPAALHYSGQGLEEAYFGETKEAYADVDEALRLASTRDVQSGAALALAVVGNIGRAEKLADQLNKSFPLDTLMQRSWLPTIHAAVELERRNAHKATELLQATTPYEFSGAGTDSIYIRGQAYLMLHDGSAASAEFQKIIDHRGVVGNDPVGALAHLGLARSYAIQGDTAKAKTAYNDFLTLWKDADPGIPILKQAKARYAKLQ